MNKRVVWSTVSALSVVCLLSCSVDFPDPPTTAEICGVEDAFQHFRHHVRGNRDELFCVDRQGKRHGNYWLKQEIRDGTMFGSYEVVSEGQYSHGVKVGWWTEFGQDGTVTREFLGEDFGGSTTPPKFTDGQATSAD